MRLVYNVYDDDYQIESKQFDNFQDALEYAKQGLITYICEEDLDCPGCEERVVWTWDSTWEEQDAIENLEREQADDFFPMDENIEISISGPADEIKSLAELVFDNAFDVDFDEPAEEIEVECPDCADEFGYEEEPAVKDLEFDDDEELEVGEPEIIEDSEDKNIEDLEDEEVELEIGKKFTDNRDDELESEDEDQKLLQEDQVNELFDLDLNVGVDGGDNNDVSVLSSYAPKKGKNKLDELFDADINLSLDGGTGNNVSVLSPLGGLGEALQEGLNNAEREEYFQLCKEIGIKGTKDLESFMKEVGLEAGCDPHKLLDALREYRAELGSDFKIIHEEALKEETKLATQYILGYHNGNNYVFWLDDSRSFGAENFTYDLNNYNIKEFDSYEQAKMLGYIADEQWRKETGYEYYSIAVKTHNKNEYVITGSYEGNTRYYDYDNNEWVDEITETCIFDSYNEANETKKYVNRFVSTEPLFMPLYIDQNGNIQENCLEPTRFTNGDINDFACVERNIKESLKESVDLPTMRVSEIERELDLHGDIYFNLLEPVDESDEGGWRGASEIRIVDTGSEYAAYYEWLDQEGDYVYADQDPKFTCDTFEELLTEINGLYVVIEDLEEYLKDTLDEEIKMTKDELLDKEGTTDVDLINAGRPEEERVELTESDDYYQPDRELVGYVIVDIEYGAKYEPVYLKKGWEKFSQSYFDDDTNYSDGYDVWYDQVITRDLDEAELYDSAEKALETLADFYHNYTSEYGKISDKNTFLLNIVGQANWDISNRDVDVYKVKPLYHCTQSWNELDEQLTEGRQPVYSNVIFYYYDKNNNENTITKTNLVPKDIRAEVNNLIESGATRVYVEAKINGEWEPLDKYTYDPEWTPGTPEYAARNGKDFALAVESLDQEDDLTDQEFAEQLQARLQETSMSSNVKNRPEAPKDLTVVKEPGDQSISEGDFVWFDTRRGEDVVVQIIKFTKDSEGKRNGCRAVYTEPKVTRPHKERKDWWKEDKD